MADSLTSKEKDLGNEGHDGGGGIGSDRDIAGGDAPQEESSLQSLEMDSVAHDGGGGISCVEDAPQEEKSLETLEMDSVAHDERDTPEEEKSLENLEMDSVAHDNVKANEGTDKPQEENNVAPSIELELNDKAVIADDEDNLKEESCVAPSKELEIDYESHNIVEANGEQKKPLEEKSSMVPSKELDVDHEVGDKAVIPNFGDNLREESCVAPSKELGIDYETYDKVEANGETDYEDDDQVVNANVREYTLTDIPIREENCATPSKEMDYEADDNAKANGETDKPLGEKNNMAPSIELELDYKAADQVVIAPVGDNTVTDIPLKEENCVAPTKELENVNTVTDIPVKQEARATPSKEMDYEMDYETDNNIESNGRTDKPLGEKINTAPSIELEFDYEADDTVTDIPLKEESCVAPTKELENDYEDGNQVVIDNGRRNSVPESFVALSKEVELDYEADEEVVIDKLGTSKPLKEESHVEPLKDTELDFEAENEVESNEILKVEQCPSLQPENQCPNELDIARQNCGNSISVKTMDDLDDELEDGEIKDEDESPKKELVKPRPRPECKFYAKGRCTRGSQCRFLHPGVPDLRGFSIFTPPRPVLSGILVETVTPLVETDLPPPPPEPQRESAWERGLRAAKEMRRLSDQRKKVDFEYEEKKSSMSITQIEMDKEHDYNSRPATPMDREHDYNSRGYYREDHPRTEPYPSRGYYREDHFSTEPYNNNFRSNRPSSGYAHDSYNEQLDHFKDRHSRVGPPASSNEKPRLTGHEDTEFPWMDNKAGGYSPRSTSAGSSMSASSRASPRYSSPESRRSTSRSRSRTPPDATSSSQTSTKTREGEAAKKCTAPLQKRLAGFASNKLMKSKSKSRKTDRENKTSAKKLVRAMSGISQGSNSLSQLHQPVQGKSNKDQIRETKVKIESAKSADLTSTNQKDPVKMNTSLPKNKIKLTLKAYHATRSPNKTVLEKLGMSHEDEPVTGDGKKLALKRKGSDKDNSGSSAKKKCYGDQGNQEKDLVPTEHISKASGYVNEDLMKASIKNEEKKKKKSSPKSRKEELMKQLKAVEDAITKKRDKLVEN